jgi:nitroreductase
MKNMVTVPYKEHDPMNHEILPAIANRWSPRAFSKEQISKEDLGKLLEAARWAASSMNEQPWRLIYAYQGEEAFDKILVTLMEGNRLWAKDASMLMLTIVKKDFSMNGRPNKAAHHDLGLAIGNLSIQATEIGIGLHQMGGFDPRKAEELFDLPEGYEAVTAIAMGYFGDPEQLEEPFKSRETGKRTRKSIEDFAFHGKFRKE